MCVAAQTYAAKLPINESERKNKANLTFANAQYQEVTSRWLNGPQVNSPASLAARQRCRALLFF